MIRPVMFLLFVGMVSTQKQCTKEIPEVDRPLYVGNEISARLERKQDPSDFISCTDPRFGQMICRTAEAEQCMIETYIVNCKGWEPFQSKCGLQKPTAVTPLKENFNEDNETQVTRRN